MELSLTAGIFMATLIFAAWQGSELVFGRLRTLFQPLARRPWVASAALAVLATVVYSIPSVLGHVPAPVIHDEFAYLLAGDTFSHFRLSNPSHPLARFFETFHVIQTPTYAAKFPPGLGLTLAVGFWLGLPIIGIWLTLALATAAIYWMLLAVVPRRVAFVAALLAAIHPTVIWFSQTYWGGGLSVLGGALLSGSLLRLASLQSSDRISFSKLGLIAGAGAGLLALSRPFEGMLTTVGCGIAILAIAWRRRIPIASLVRYISAAAVLPMVVVAWMLYYDLRVTGKPLVMPYVLHTARYMSAPLFFWQSIPPMPVYPNEQMRQFHTSLEFVEYADSLGWAGYSSSFFNRGGLIAWAYLRSILLLMPLGACVFAYRNQRRRRIVLICMLISAFVLAIHLFSCPWMRIAYMAPLFGLLMVTISLGLRQIAAWRVNHQNVGRPIARAIVITQIAMGAYALWFAIHQNERAQISQRQSILKDLQHQPGEHLVIVSYDPKHSPMQEWVYNGSNIDQSKVIFARDLGHEANQQLLDYYSHRNVWHVRVDRTQVSFEMEKPAPSLAGSASSFNAASVIP